MIKTTFDSSFDLKAAIQKGTKVGILGCSSCASVYRTGDTEKIDEVRELLKDHCEVILATSIDSPCDQRVLRYLFKTLPRFEEVETFVVLACEAGTRSLGGLIGKNVVSPVRTHAFSIRSVDGKERQACLFCDECSYPNRSCHCPIAGCPIKRTDGPCQNRLSDNCIVDEKSRCVWLDVPVDKPELEVNKSVEHSMPLPAMVVSAPGSFAEIEKLKAAITKWQVSSVFVASSVEGLSPLVVLSALKEGIENKELGLCVDGRDRNCAALTTELRTARALGVKNVFLKEPDWTFPGVINFESTVNLLELIDARGDFGTVIVENSFLHESDLFLLDTQIAAGANLVASSLNEGHLEEAKEYASMTVPLVSLAAENTAQKGEQAIYDLTGLPGEVVFELGDQNFG